MNRILSIREGAELRAVMLREELVRLTGELMRVEQEIRELAQFQAWLDTHPPTDPPTDHPI